MADKPFEQAVQGLETGPQASDAAKGAAGVAGEDSQHQTVAALRKKFGADIIHHVVYSGDEHCVYIAPEKNLAILKFLRDDPAQRYDFLQDVTAIDFGGG